MEKLNAEIKYAKGNTKEAKTRYWHLFKKFVLYPLICLGLIFVFVMQIIAMCKTKGVVAVEHEIAEEEVEEVATLILQ